MKKATERAPLRTWWIYPPQVKDGRRFQALTKSEARAKAKEAFGYRGRLPVGTVIVEEKV